MTRDELEHAIRASCDVAGEEIVIVFGSQSILGQYPNAPADLRQSLEADIAPGSGDPQAADRIDAALGENSHFHRTHGFYVHGLTIDAACLPKGGRHAPLPSAARQPTRWRGAASRRTIWPRASWWPSATRTVHSCAC